MPVSVEELREQVSGESGNVLLWYDDNTNKFDPELIHGYLERRARAYENGNNRTEWYEKYFAHADVIIVVRYGLRDGGYLCTFRRNHYESIADVGSRYSRLENIFKVDKVIGGDNNYITLKVRTDPPPPLPPPPEPDTMKHILLKFKQIILQGPPGTGKTHEALALTARMFGLPSEAAYRWTDPSDENKQSFSSYRFNPDKLDERGGWDIVQFHPAYNYEEFVRGIQVETNDSGQVVYETKHRVFSQLCAAAKANPKGNYILIIDEINRAHLAAVLGELIYGLEYRNQPVRTPYAVGKKEPEPEEPADFSLTVPPNLYIIGTMNTADRSIGHIDYAVRRRFAFHSLLPDRGVVAKYCQENDLPRIAAELFDRVAAIFSGDRLSKEFHADDVQPGHTYFLAADEDEIFLKFAYQVVPLLREYAKDGILVGDISLSLPSGESVLISGSGMTPPEEILNMLKRCAKARGQAV